VVSNLQEMAEEKQMRPRTIRIMVGSGVVLIGFGLLHFSLTSLDEPGFLETHVATAAKRALIRFASRHESPPPPVEAGGNVESGRTHYGLNCGICHGVDGRSQTPSGRWMYPRAADLTSNRVQSYSDQELFWIINNGIRFTGMPGFGKVETANDIWGLVRYVRTLPNTR